VALHYETSTLVLLCWDRRASPSRNTNPDDLSALASGLVDNATKFSELGQQIATKASSADVAAAVSGLASSADVAAAVSGLASSADVAAAVTGLASSSPNGERGEPPDERLSARDLIGTEGWHGFEGNPLVHF
jgi:hypothetical protein